MSALYHDTVIQWRKAPEETREAAPVIVTPHPAARSVPFQIAADDGDTQHPPAEPA